MTELNPCREKGNVVVASVQRGWNENNLIDQT